MTITIASDPSGPLKRDIVERAFGLLGMAGYEFGREPEEVAFAIGELETLMAEWETDFGFTGYAYSDEAGDGAEASGIARADVNGVAAGLAEAIAAINGKTLSPEANRKIARAVAGLKARYASIPTMPYGRTIGGMGRRYSGPFLIDDTADPPA